MFFSDKLLVKGGPFYACWVAENYPTEFHKWSREIIESIDVIRLCELLMKYLQSNSFNPANRLSIRLSSKLVCGTLKIYNERQKLLFNDADLLIQRMRVGDIYERGLSTRRKRRRHRVNVEHGTRNVASVTIEEEPIPTQRVVDDGFGEVPGAPCNVTLNIDLFGADGPSAIVALPELTINDVRAEAPSVIDVGAGSLVVPPELTINDVVRAEAPSVVNDGAGSLVVLPTLTTTNNVFGAGGPNANVVPPESMDIDIVETANNVRDPIPTILVTSASPCKRPLEDPQPTLGEHARISQLAENLSFSLESVLERPRKRIRRHRRRQIIDDITQIPQEIVEERARDLRIECLMQPELVQRQGPNIVHLFTNILCLNRGVISTRLTESYQRSCRVPANLQLQAIGSRPVVRGDPTDVINNVTVNVDIEQDKTMQPVSMEVDVADTSNNHPSFGVGLPISTDASFASVDVQLHGQTTEAVGEDLTNLIASLSLHTLDTNVVSANLPAQGAITIEQTDQQSIRMEENNSEFNGNLTCEINASFDRTPVLVDDPIDPEVEMRIELLNEIWNTHSVFRKIWKAQKRGDDNINIKTLIDSNDSMSARGILSERMIAARIFRELLDLKRSGLIVIEKVENTNCIKKIYSSELGQRIIQDFENKLNNKEYE